jgi:peptidoglycan hydrolase CwlO-like protein
MASLKDAEKLTKTLEEAVSELKTELRDGKGDFEKLVKLSDEVSERADKVAETFSSMSEVLNARIRELSGSGSNSSGDGSTSRGRAASRS